MSQSNGQHLHLVGCSHESAPLELREKLSLDSAALQQLYADLLALEELQEVVVLHTCNRLEIYAVGHSPKEAFITKEIATATDTSEEVVRGNTYTLEGQAVIQHLFEVAAGLRSQLIGETEIFGQVKDAYAEACEHKSAGRSLHKLFQKSFQAGKWARTHTAINQGHVSLGNIAVDLAARVFGKLTKSHALVIGGGDVGRDVTKALHSRGLKKITVTSRREETARLAAAEVDGEASPFESWKAVLETVDVAIFATASPGSLLRAEEVSRIMPKRNGDPLLLIDLAMPRDVEAGCGDIESVYLYDLADLSDIANTNREIREGEVDLCRSVLKQRAEATWDLIGDKIGHP